MAQLRVLVKQRLTKEKWPEVGKRLNNPLSRHRVIRVNMPAKIPLLDHMLIRFKGTLVLSFFSHTCDWCFIISCFINTKMPLCPVALTMFVFKLCNSLDIVRVQGWWCNLVLFPAGSQTSEQEDRKSKGNSDKPCENGVRSHSRCSVTLSFWTVLDP